MRTNAVKRRLTLNSARHGFCAITFIIFNAVFYMLDVSTVFVT